MPMDYEKLALRSMNEHGLSPEAWIDQCASALARAGGCNDPYVVVARARELHAEMKALPPALAAWVDSILKPAGR